MLKKVFPLLLSYVFVTTQCWAISGGPNYGNGIVSAIGTYSGVLVGLTEADATTSGPTIPGDPVDTTPSSETTSSSNALGLFDLTVPNIGTAAGAFLLFADGYVFTGTIDGSVDPDTDALKGIVQGTFTFTLSEVSDTGTVASTTVTAQAVGMINAKIGGTKSSSNVAARINGTAFLDISFGDVNPNTLAPVIDRVITFDVSGFKQTTSTTSTASTIGTATSGGSTGAGGSGG